MMKRIAERERRSVEFFLDGRQVVALEGDTVLTAILVNADHVRVNEFSGEPRAGFCLMGACQDCWVSTEGGDRFRACTTFIEGGMRLVTSR